jgi:hypothetical protein
MRGYGMGCPSIAATAVHLALSIALLLQFEEGRGHKLQAKTLQHPVPAAQELSCCRQIIHFGQLRIRACI